MYIRSYRTFEKDKNHKKVLPRGQWSWCGDVARERCEVGMPVAYIFGGEVFNGSFVGVFNEFGRSLEKQVENEKRWFHVW